jgi:hypothetical protein
MKLTDLEPQFLKRSKPTEYDLTNDIHEADALQMRCPACHWAWGRTGHGHVHTLTLWLPEPPLWCFEGTGYKDLSLMAGRVAVTMTTGCRAEFWVKKGKVDFA